MNWSCKKAHCFEKFKLQCKKFFLRNNFFTRNSNQMQNFFLSEWFTFYIFNLVCDQSFKVVRRNSFFILYIWFEFEWNFASEGFFITIVCWKQTYRDLEYCYFFLLVMKISYMLTLTKLANSVYLNVITTFFSCFDSFCFVCNTSTRVLRLFFVCCAIINANACISIAININCFWNAMQLTNKYQVHNIQID